MFIGIDDTDSTRGMCTTYLGAILVDALGEIGEVGRRRLIRLNPNIRWRTRGNAAVCLELDTTEPEIAKDAVLGVIRDHADFEEEKTNPGAAFLEGPVPPELKEFYWRAVQDVIQIEDARQLAEKLGVDAYEFKNGRGIIGAMAAIGAQSLPDHTYELIAYREPERWGTPRKVDEESVWRADRLTYPGQWDTVDRANHILVFLPGGPDPVLFGIRGDDPEAIWEAYNTIKSEPVGRHVLYKTNQGTDAHIIPAPIGEAREERSYKVRGTVKAEPYTIEGGHVFTELEDETGRIKLAAFEPTKQFRDIIRSLIPGDEIIAYGSVSNTTLNLEKIQVVSLATAVETRNPRCPVCHRRMESAGRDQGYRCRSCRTKEEEVEKVELERDLEAGWYEVPPSARRHLAKPLIRMRDGEDVHPSR